LGFEKESLGILGYQKAIRESPQVAMDTNGNISQSEGRDPSGFLGEIIGSQVTVKLNSGVVYKGQELCYARYAEGLIPIYRRTAVRGWIHEYCA
jgi:hypothetical protein